MPFDLSFQAAEWLWALLAIPLVSLIAFPWWRRRRRAAEAYADLAVHWVAAGATVVGGCCGTGPLHIAALKRRFA